MSVELLMLGSHSEAFSHRRYHTSQLLKIQNDRFLINCGDGVKLLLKKYQIKLSRADHIFISYLPWGHYLGLIGLFFSLRLFGRCKDLPLVAPLDPKKITGLQLRYFETLLGFKINYYIEFKLGISEVVYDYPMYEIIAPPMDHRVSCSGYLFKEKSKKRQIKSQSLNELNVPKAEIIALKEKQSLLGECGLVRYKNEGFTLNSPASFSYAYCSDSRLKMDLKGSIKEVDLLYHEATCTSEIKKRGFKACHSTAEQATTFAKEANVKKLILGHPYARYNALNSILSKVQSIFERAELAIKGSRFHLNEK